MAHNVTYAIEGEDLVLRVKLTQGTIAAAPPSSTGKTVVIGSTGGGIPAAPAFPGVKVNLTVYSGRAA